MKKILFAAAVLSMMTATSCLKSNEGSNNANQESEEATETIEAVGAEAVETVEAVIAEAESTDGAAEVAIPSNVPPVFVKIIESDPTVKVLPSGLAYKVNKIGKGENPTPTSNVTVLYCGKHVNGDVFDQSEQPIDFNLQQVIAGFREGITQMNRGANYTLYIPSDLGYGERGAGGVIAPNEPLIFDIELIDFSD